MSTDPSPDSTRQLERIAKNRRQFVASAPWLAAFFVLAGVVLVVAMFGDSYSRDGRNLGRLIVAVGFFAISAILLVLRPRVRRLERERGPGG